MKLTFLERLVALSVLGKEGDIIFLRAKRELQDKIGFSAEEIEKFGIRSAPEGGVLWNPDAPQDFEVDLSEAEKKMISSGLKSLNQQQKLTESHVSLYEKFVEEN